MKGKSVVGARRAVRIVVLAAVVVLGSACCGLAPAPAPPEPKPLVADPAPQDQRSIAAFEERPCDLLSPAQLSSLGLNDIGVTNLRSATELEPLICFAVRASTPGGLEPDDVQWAVYARFDVAEVLAKGTVAPRVVRRLTIEGLPTVVLEDITSFYRCSLAVKTAPGQVIALAVRRDREEIGDTCDYATRVAEEMVRTLPRATP